MGRRRSFTRQLRGKWKVIAIWLPLLSVALLWRLVRHCDQRKDGLCEAALDYTLAFVTFIDNNLLLVIPILLSLPVCYFAYLKLTEEDKTVPGFKNFPEQFDKRIIRLVGKVEYVLSDKLTEKLKRRGTDIYRTMTNNEDKANRYVHQRFLISSPLLQRGERLMVHHNTSFGKLRLRKGLWVDVQGEYIHKPSKRRKGTTHYGLMHHTHKPKGSARVLKGKPHNVKGKKVKVAPSKGRKKSRKILQAQSLGTNVGFETTG